MAGWQQQLIIDFGGDLGHIEDTRVFKGIFATAIDNNSADN